MKHSKVIALFLVLIPAFGLAQHKTKKPSNLSVVFQSARYVYVESADGDMMKPGLYPADRQAISDTEDGLRDWSRYALTTRRQQADLVLVVRKGRIANAQGHGGISVGTRTQQSNPAPGRPPGQAADADEIGAASEMGPADDMLRVYTVNTDGKLSSPIWTQEMKDGLDAPAIPLLQQLRAAVERAYPNPPATKPATP
jgi:hypothetical protein